MTTLLDSAFDWKPPRTHVKSAVNCEVIDNRARSRSACVLFSTVTLSKRDNHETQSQVPDCTTQNESSQCAQRKEIRKSQDRSDRGWSKDTCVSNAHTLPRHRLVLANRMPSHSTSVRIYFKHASLVASNWHYTHPSQPTDLPASIRHALQAQETIRSRDLRQMFTQTRLQNPSPRLQYRLTNLKR